MKKTEIDFVVTWLDSNDPEWQEAYFKYKPDSKGPKGNARFRNMDIFRYWFRAVELYAPWVNKVYLITNGKFPSWINTENKKLVLVKHSDYIPQDYLPTFSSCTIELFMHRIQGLSMPPSNLSTISRMDCHVTSIKRRAIMFPFTQRQTSLASICRCWLT